MKKLQISGKEFIRQDGLYYNLTDLFRLTTLNGIRLEAWAWAQSENRSRDISRRGWFFKKSWAKASVLIEYAKYLTPGLYTDVLRALNMDDPNKLIDLFGELKASRLDYRVIDLITERDDQRAKKAARLTEQTLEAMRTVKVDHRASEMRRVRQSTPTRSMTHSRSMGPSVQHHRSEPDYLTQALVTQHVMNNWDDSSHRSHSSHSRHDDVCSTPSHSSHSSHDSGHSWSGDSGGGGCGD